MSDELPLAKIIRTELRATANAACGDPSSFGLAFQEMERCYGQPPMRSALIVDYLALATAKAAIDADFELMAILDRFADRVQSIDLVYVLGDREIRKSILFAPAPAAPP
jgi:hypothetical protein